MILIDNLKQKAKLLKNEITALYYAFKNPRLCIFPKILIAITIGYALSPVDLIPDFIPVLGYIDDLIILPALLALSIRLIPEKIMIESRKIAAENPVKLKKNWVIGTFFIIIWIFLVLLVIRNILQNKK